MASQITNLERNKGKVFVMARTFMQETDGAPICRVQAPTLMMGRSLHVNISTPLPPTRAERKLMSEEEQLLSNVRQDRYRESVDWLSVAVLEEIANHLFEMRDAKGTSRLDELFVVNSLIVPQDIILGEIARGGSRPTAVALDWFRKHFGLRLHKLWAGSQRKGTRDEMGADAEVKGKEDLTGMTLLILEQAAATITTIPTVLRKWFNRCESVPDRVIVGAFHGTIESLRRLQNMGNSDDASDPLNTLRVDVVCAMLHQDMNDDGYLIHPGCGDVGVMDVGLRDK